MWQGGLLPSQGLWMMAPASYLEFLDLMQHAAMVITDSGGVQEETTFLGVPCLTYREHTERPVTVTLGTNRVVGCEPRELVRSALGLLASLGEARQAVVRQAVARPPLWDGQTAPRIVNVLKQTWPRGRSGWRSTFLSPEAVTNDVAKLRQTIERLRTWIEARAIAGYEPFDLLNSPYLRGGLARQALPAILLIQAGKRFGGLRLRQLLKCPPAATQKPWASASRPTATLREPDMTSQLRRGQRETRWFSSAPGMSRNTAGDTTGITVPSVGRAWRPSPPTRLLRTSAEARCSTWRRHSTIPKHGPWVTP